ncbi:unnamed protein product [Cyprideis torosa]|uniref:Uncharacterized protein n=1 Tax=Cyprideis torosa TaxID=163714 RepID=A0A7R8ZTQ2_9CRUS|nr:unnamed protein product [Cyprideis torosa]CAG0898618.1 unnamed protein product [Cyprideis torosa]
MRPREPRLSINAGTAHGENTTVNGATTLQGWVETPLSIFSKHASLVIMPSVDLYTLPLSPPCRAVLLTAKALDVDVNEILCDPRTGETRTPEFLKMNPCHQIPTMKDGNLVIGESRAIMMYLANKYGEKCLGLYPNCPEERAVVDNLLFFDMGLTSRYTGFYRPIIFGDAKAIDDSAKASTQEGLELLEALLTSRGGPWAAGEKMTIADHALIASVSSIHVHKKYFNFDKLPKVQEWMKLCETKMKDYSIANGPGLKDYEEFQLASFAKKLGGN